jgi:hypothetical protein
MAAAPAGSVFAALEDVLVRHGDAILSGEGLALSVPGFGDTPRAAHEALALTALAAGDGFWSELEAATNRWSTVDDERRELVAFQSFITPGPGETIAEARFERDWPAWDAARAARQVDPRRRRWRCVAFRRSPRMPVAMSSRPRGCTPRMRRRVEHRSR